MNTRALTRQEGQTLAEFAIVIPIVVLMLLALFDAGRAVVFYTELTNASRVGARVAMVNQSNSDQCSSGDVSFKCAAAAQTSGMGIEASDIDDVTIAGSECGLIGACTATVSVEYAFEPITPVVGWMLGPITLSASTSMPIERLYPSP
jgi:Flp pilus assembly protein TadG